MRSISGSWTRIEQAGGALGFQSLDWARRMAESFASPDKSLIVAEVVSQKTGEPVMLLPLTLHNLVGYRLITWFDFGVVDYAAPLVAPGLTVDATFAVGAWDAVRRALPHVDLIHIDKIPPTAMGRPNPLALLPGVNTSRAQCFSVDLAEPAPKDSNQKERARRNRRLAERGPVHFLLASTEAEVDTLFDALRQQRRERFAALGRYDLLASEAYADFYRRAAHDGLRGGCVRLFGLAVGDLWLATAYGLVSPSMFHLVIPTMREGEWRRYSPGLLLIERVMEWSRAQGHETFDFSIGDLSYKADMGGEPEPLFELFATQSSRGLVVRSAAAGLEASKAWLARRPLLFDWLRRTRQQIRRSLSR